ncbi:MAG TPA: glucoamylase family protein, partial [Aggregatilineales bacterium]|nr:glucoamylase family protein [Aggregatilineales bacterium]
GVDDPVVAPKKKAWEAALGGVLAARPHLKDRLKGWPQRLLIDPRTLPSDQREFLYRLALDTWRGIDALTDREHGLPIDRVHFSEGSLAPEDADIGDYASVTDIGFHLLAIVAAHELKFINREEALGRLRLTLASLERMETYRGSYYNYYDTTTLERTSHFISFVDSSWLTAGLMTVRMAFPEIGERCTRLIERGDYRFFYDERRQLMSHGFYANLGLRAAYHYGALYSEARLGSLIAIGKGEAPQAHWFAMARTFLNEYTWQSNQPLNRWEKSERGFHWIGGYYQWRDYRYVPSWGGSLFEALMPALLLDEQRYAPASLGRNGEVHTEIQRRYALEDLGYPVWGMSPSSVPGSGLYAEYGVHLLGALGYREGVVTPHAAALALLTEPEAASANLRQLAQRYPIYGDFGFYDALDPKSGQVAYQYLCLDQAMILTALANHLEDHAVQKHFAADPIMQRVLPLIGFENFFD